MIPFVTQPHVCHDVVGLDSVLNESIRLWLSLLRKHRLCFAVDKRPFWYLQYVEILGVSSGLDSRRVAREGTVRGKGDI